MQYIHYTDKYDHSNPLFQTVAKLGEVLPVPSLDNYETETMLFIKTVLFPQSPYFSCSFLTTNSVKVDLTLILMIYTLRKLEISGNLSRRRINKFREYVTKSINTLYDVEPLQISDKLKFYDSELQKSLRTNDYSNFVDRVATFLFSKANVKSKERQEIEVLFTKFDKFVNTTIDELCPIYEIRHL